MTDVVVGPVGMTGVGSIARDLGASMVDEVPVYLAARVLMLPGWEHCPVAVAHAETARVLGLPVLPVELADVHAA